MPSAALDLDLGNSLLEIGWGHLTGDGALPNQFVERSLVSIEVLANQLRLAARIGRADRFVRFLGVLGFGFVFARKRRVALAELGRDDVAYMADRFGHDLDAVGSHVGDETDQLAADIDAFVEPLGDLHRLLRGEAELAGGVHLQRRGRERRIRIAFRGFLFDRSDAEILSFDRRLYCAGRGFVLDVEFLERGACDCHEAGFDVLVLGRGEQGFDRPVFLRPERLDLGLAVANEPQSNRLDAARRAGPRQLAPEHGREGEADEIVERPASQIGRHKRLIDLARLFHCRKDRLLGDGVEGDALDLGIFPQRLFVAQNLQNVPGNGFALAIGVGRQDQFVGLFDRFSDFPHDFLRLAIDVPVHGKIVVGLHRAVLRRQIAYMPVGCNDLVAGT